MSTDDELCSYLERAVERNASSVDDLELYASESTTLSVRLKRGELSEAKHSHLRGVGARVVVEGRIGFSSTTELERVDECIGRARKLSSFGEKLTGWEGFPAPSTFTSVSGLYDESVLDIGVEDACALSLELARVPSQRGAVLSSGELSFASGVDAICNSSGLVLCEPQTLAYAHGEVVARENDLVASAYDFELSRSCELPLRKMAERMSDTVIAGLHPTAMDKTRGTLVLRPPAVADVLDNAFIPSLSMDSVLKGRSALAGKLDQKVASDVLSITDDGLLDGGLGSSRADDEGTASSTKLVLENGVLRTFLSDVYTGYKTGEKSTGNGVRGSYSTPPSPSVRNLIVDAPPTQMDELGDGVLITNLIGAHTANPITGELSVEGRGAFLIEDGHVGRAVGSVMLSVNVFELLEKLRASLDDTRQMGELITASLVFEDVELFGAH